MTPWTDPQPRLHLCLSELSGAFAVQVDTVDLPAAVQAGAGLPGGGARQLVPGAGDGAGE
jgi:hypothetical protein